MTEFIITSKQLEKMLDAVNSYLMVGELIGYEPSRPVNEVVISGEELPVLVRCRDCKYLDTPDWDEVLAAQYGEPPVSCMRPDGNGDYMRFEIEPDGFCKWGERK